MIRSFVFMRCLGSCVEWTDTSGVMSSCLEGGASGLSRSRRKEETPCPSLCPKDIGGVPFIQCRNAMAGIIPDLQLRKLNSKNEMTSLGLVAGLMEPGSEVRIVCPRS
jgi:hypothetical protein